jgi:hypothetical protein
MPSKRNDGWGGDYMNASSNRAGLAGQAGTHTPQKPAATIACCVLCDAIRFARGELEIELREQGFKVG